MDMLDQALDPSDQKGSDSADEVTLVNQGSDDGEDQGVTLATQGTLTLDPNIQYQFRTDASQAGPVTYRVIQMGSDGSPTEGQVVTTAALPAVIQSPFSNGGSPSEPITGTDSRFTYVPQATAETQPDLNAATLGQVATAGGQFYVMMSPQDVLQGQRQLAPRAQGAVVKNEGQRTSRDDRRRATHNEVERRRRDKINNWIVQLSKVVPDCVADTGKTGQVNNRSKGGILAKACDYITNLRNQNQALAERVNDMDKMAVDTELLRQQCEELKQENSLLRSQMQQHGIVITDVISTS